ncbi:unnamed protein product, partial [Rotaria magnacalcarata]
FTPNTSEIHTTPFETDRCDLCDKLYNNKRRLPLKNSPNLFNFIGNLYYSLFQKRLSDDIVICAACYTRHSKTLKITNDTRMASHGTVEPMDYENAVDTTRSEAKVDVLTQNVPITIPPYSNKYCCICNAKFSTQRVITLSDDVRMNTFKFYLIYLRYTSRCCRSHLENNYMKSYAIDALNRNYPEASFVTYELLSTMIKEIQIELKRTSQSLITKYSSVWKKDQFRDLCTQVTMCNTDNRSIEMAIGCSLTKLRLGVSNKVLKTLFSFSSDRLVAQINDRAYKTLLKFFVPQHLGFQHKSRNDIINNHTRSSAKNLLANREDVAILILDGTYIYCQKSANNVLQRRLFSLHKNRPLLKPMIICAADRYIISAIGPYLSDWYNNDAAITKHILLNNKEEVQDWLVEKDIMIVDRGFRDCLDLVNSFGYTTFMLLFLPKSKKQFSTSEANNNRFVTALRWVVESVNGRIKTLKFFEHVVQNSSLLYVHGYLSIVSAIVSAYRSTFINDTSNDDYLSKAFLEKRNKQNELEAKLNDEERNKSEHWKKINADDCITDFPKLTEADLKDFTLGVLQLKQARSYALEHISEDGQYEIHVCKQQQNLLRANLQRITRHGKHKYLNQRSSSYMKLCEDAIEVSDLSSDKEDDDAISYSSA